MSTDPTATPDQIETTSLYEQIVADFLARAGKDDAIPDGTVRHLKAAFAAGPPKPAVLVDAFRADDDLE
jgi:hypothetical protein